MYIDLPHSFRVYFLNLLDFFRVYIFLGSVEQQLLLDKLNNFIKLGTFTLVPSVASTSSPLVSSVVYRDRGLSTQLRQRLVTYFINLNNTVQSSQYKTLYDTMSPGLQETTLETGGEDVKIHSNRVEKMGLQGEVSLESTQKWITRVWWLNQCSNEFIIQVARGIFYTRFECSFKKLKVPVGHHVSG